MTLPQRTAQRRPVWRRRLRLSVRILVVVAVGIPLLAVSTAAASFGVLLFGNLPGTVPEKKPPPVSQPTYVYDGQGNQIAVFREFDLTIPIQPQDVPEVLKDAVISAEDRKFWTHKGIDPEGLVRAGLTNYREGAVVQGGSTITQQYVKSAYLTDERTLSRKLDEAVLATRLERDLTTELGSEHAAKEEILFRYLNETYFGGGAYGAGAAAQTYFRKDVKDLTVSEAATLAGVIPAPSQLGPRENILLAESRRQEVLKQMLDQGAISELQFLQAYSQPLWYMGFGDPAPGQSVTPVYPPPDSGATKYPYFVDYVRQYLLEHYGPEKVFRGGLHVETTIDPKLQADAELAVASQLKGTSSPLEMSLVSVEPSTGYVKALVGGRDFSASQVNLATGGSTGMPPGSSFKPFTIAAALEEGFTPDTVYDAEAVYYPAGCKQSSCAIYNSEGEGTGPITMRAATTSSVNTYFAPLARDVGPDNVVQMAKRLGLDHFLDTSKSYDERVTLGYTETSPLDMAAAYSVFANHGYRQEATPIVKITEPDGNVLEDNSQRDATPVLNTAVADTVTDMLRGPVTTGTASGSLGSFPRPAAGKTGTTNDNTNAWFVGFTPQLSTAVWMGHSDGLYPLRNINGVGQVFGGTIPAKTWGIFMGAALDGLPSLEFPVPGELPVPGQVGDNSRPVVRKPLKRSPTDLSTDCGGPCVLSSNLPQAADPPQAPAAATSSTTTTAAPTTPTTKKGQANPP